MKLIAGLLAAGHAEKLRFGANQCTFGPAHWCQDIVTASNCGKGAITYCSQNEWNKDTAPTESCESCKTAIGLVNMYLTDNKTRADVKEVLDYACFKCPEQEACKKMIDDETDKVFDFIQSIVDPETVCTGLRICSTEVDESFYKAIEMNIEDMPSTFVKVKEPELPPIPFDLDSKLIESPSKTLKAAVNDDRDMCSDCTGFVDLALDQIKNDPEGMYQKAQHAAMQICDILPSKPRTLCQFAVKQEFADVWRKLTSPEPTQLCTTLTYCSSSSNPTPTDHSNPCSSCANILSDYQSLPTYRQKEVFKGFSDLICEDFICRSITKQIFPIVNKKIMIANPKQSCQDAGFCQNNRLPLLKTNLGNTGCDICKLAVIKIDEALEDKETDGEVMDYAEQACDLLPAYSDQCKAAIEMYGPQMIKMVEDNLKPNVICASVGLCNKAADWRLPESCAQPAQAGFCRALMPSYYFNTDSGLCEKFNYGGCGGNSNRFETLKQCEDRCENALGMGICEDCKLAIDYVKAYIEDKGNQEDIEQALEHICDSVPDSFKMECQDIVDVYGPQILQFADGVLDPNFICEKAQLCSTPTSRTPLGIDECTLGPRMWCSSVEMAKKCKAYQYCKDKGLLPEN